jgi:hypothetical protein
MHGHECIRHDDKPASRFAPKGDDGGFDLLRQLVLRPIPGAAD